MWVKKWIYTKTDYLLFDLIFNIDIIIQNLGAKILNIYIKYKKLQNNEYHRIDYVLYIMFCVKCRGISMIFKSGLRKRWRIALRAHAFSRGRGGGPFYAHSTKWLKTVFYDHKTNSCFLFFLWYSFFPRQVWVLQPLV